MRVWQIPSFGLDQLSLVDVPSPTPARGEIRARVEAVSLNYRDGEIVDNGMGERISFPFTPASDMVGTVVALGDGVDRFSVGDRIVTAFVTGWIDGTPPRWEEAPIRGGPLPGVLAEEVCVAAEWCARAPQHLSAAEGSTLPTAGLTAWTALVELGRLHAGQTVVAQGTGGVSLFAAQIALAHGARVIVTSGSDAKLARLASLGPIEGVRRTEGAAWDEEVLALTGGRGADHILEMAGGDNLARSLAAVAPGGRVSMIGLLASDHFAAPTPALIASRATIAGIAVGSRRALENFVRASEAMLLRPVIDAIYPFERAPEALRRLREGPFGKIVIDLNR